MKFGSLFAGVGGFDLGFERAGMTCAWQVEKDDNASAVLAKHWPDVKRYKDVNDVGKHNLSPVDLICGGFPCQDVSVAGRRKGLAGKRSGLWFEFLRLIGELRPAWVVIENVPGLLSSNGGRDFAVILRGLGECGYLVAYRVLDAQYFGVPQRRRRVFIVGHLGDGRAAQVLFEREGRAGDTASGGEERQVTAALPASGAGTSRTGNARTEASMMVVTSWAMNQRNELRETDNIPAPQSSGGGRPGHSYPTVAYSVRTAQQSSNGWGIQEEAMGTLDNGKGHAVAYAVNTGEGRWKADGADNLVPSMGVRRLTPVECERLQGFPDGWTDGQADSHRYRQMGNAVAVPVVEWLGWRIMESEAA